MAHAHTVSTNDEIMARWSRLRDSRDVHLFGCLHTDLCNVPLFMLHRVQLQIKLTKPGRILPDEQDLRFKDHFQIFVRLPDGQTLAAEPSNVVGSRKALTTGALARYNTTSVDLRNFTFSARWKFQSIDNAVQGPLSKRLLFPMIKNADFNDSVDRTLQI